MSSDVPLLERLSQLPPVSVGRLLTLMEGMARPENDPLLRPLVGSPLLTGLLQHLGRKPEGTCYQALSPTLGFAAESPEWAREWLADPVTQDSLLVQQCMVRLLLAIRGMAEVRADALVAAPIQG